MCTNLGAFMPHRKLIARLQAIAGLSEQDQASLASMPHSIRSLTNGECIVHHGDQPGSCTIVMAGFLARQRTVGDRNQISAFYLPGDMPDLHSLHLTLADQDLCSLGPSTVALVGHTFLKHVLARSVPLSHALWRETLIQASIYREWVENLGSRQALPRLAHLLCELAARLDIVDLVRDGSFVLPLTQQDIADACGLSVVHVNRTIQELKRRELIEWHATALTMLRRAELEDIAEFSPSYLHAMTLPLR
jgi:CRP-like cAMP-binding protein